MDSLHTALSFAGILPKESVDYVVSFFEKKVLKSETYFLKLASTSHEIGFVSEGIIRSYTIDKHGEEITKYFVRKNQFVVDLESYYSMSPAEMALQAVVDSTLFIIHRNTWNMLSEKIPKLYILTKTLTEATLLNKIKDNDFLNYGTAVDKYQEFLRRYPDLA